MTTTRRATQHIVQFTFDKQEKPSRSNRVGYAPMLDGTTTVHRRTSRFLVETVDVWSFRSLCSLLLFIEYLCIYYFGQHENCLSQSLPARFFDTCIQADRRSISLPHYSSSLFFIACSKFQAQASTSKLFLKNLINPHHLQISSRNCSRISRFITKRDQGLLKSVDQTTTL